MPFQKGHKLSKGRPEGSKNVATIAKEERRAIFDSEVSQVFISKIHEARPEYLLDQFLGKSPDEVKLSGEIKTDHSWTEAEILAIKSGVKNKLANDKR